MIIYRLRDSDEWLMNMAYFTNHIGVFEYDMIFTIRTENGDDSVRVIDLNKGNVTSEIKDPRLPK
jgi:hypothetical protein